jgi:hypothetical protein
MSKKILAVLALAVSAVSAVGCSGGPDLQARIDVLTREQEDLQRQKELTESELLATKARCEALEKNRTSARPALAPAPVGHADPGGLRGHGHPQARQRHRHQPSERRLLRERLVDPEPRGREDDGQDRRLHPQEPFGRADPRGRTFGQRPHQEDQGEVPLQLRAVVRAGPRVVHYLVEKGHADSHRFVCEAYADNQPQSPNDKSKNRRVEIVIGKN